MDIFAAFRAIFDVKDKSVIKKQKWIFLEDSKIWFFWPLRNNLYISPEKEEALLRHFERRKGQFYRVSDQIITL